MSMTKEEALTKWCPFMNNLMGVPLKRRTEQTRCIADECMAFRKLQAYSTSQSKYVDIDKFYCGMTPPPLMAENIP